ncbi:MAG: DUF1330 domain-containing protein [Dehalococcoidia bacterium]
MPVLFIVQEEIHDPEAMAPYAAAAALAPNAGRVVAVDDHPIVLEGQWHGERTVVLEFEDEAAFRAWYESPEYQAALRIRLQATDSRAALVHTRS